MQGRFVCFGSLLPPSKSTTKLTFDQLSGELSSTTSSKKLFNFSEWTDAFLIYASVRARASPEEAVGLFKYMQTVKRVMDRGGNFVRYDEAFRTKYRGAPKIPWDQVDPEELGWAIGDPKYIPFEQLRKRQPLTAFPRMTGSGARPAQPFGSIRSTNNFQRKTCFDFNHKSCGRKLCRYEHVCMKCRGLHPVRICTDKAK